MVFASYAETMRETNLLVEEDLRDRNGKWTAKGTALLALIRLEAP
jgi:hypothetical protein